MKFYETKWKDMLTKVIIGIAIAGVFCGGCTYLNHQLGLKDDNIIEEFVEKQIENQTGLDIDLTPDSKEN